MPFRYLYLFIAVQFLFISSFGVTVSRADVVSITGSGTGTFSTDGTGHEYGQISGASGGSEISADVEIDLNLIGGIAMTVFDTVATSYPTNSAFSRPVVSSMFIPSRLIYTGNVTEDLMAQVDEAGHPDPADFDINGLLSVFPVSQGIDFSVTSLGDTCNGCLMLNNGSSSVRVFLYGFVGGTNPSGGAGSRQLTSIGGNQMKPSSALGVGSFSNHGLARFRIMGDVDESTVTVNNAPGAYLGILRITASML